MLFRRKAPALQPGDLIEVEGRPVRLAVNARARRISLRLSHAGREVVATAPSLRQLGAAAAFAQSRSAWIAARLDQLPQVQPLRPGETIEVLGQPCRLERAAMRIPARLIPATAEEPARLIAHGEPAALARAVERALRGQAMEALAARTAHHCLSLGEPLPSVRLGDPRGRWGSCRPAHGRQPAAIRYSWRLVLTPPWVLDYVAAHECAHLREANHGPRFWALVRDLYGDPARARAWLKAHGSSLHALGPPTPEG